VLPIPRIAADLSLGLLTDLHIEEWLFVTNKFLESVEELSITLAYCFYGFMVLI